MLVFIYMTVTILYSNEVEEKMYAEHKASIIRITSEQQKKEMEAIRRNEHDVEIDHLTIDVTLQISNSARKQLILWHLRQPEIQ